MPSYRIHYLKDHLRQSFRHTAHVSGAANVKPRDYAPGETVEARTPYAAYFELRGSARPIAPGDLLESESGDLRICKFIGFEEARWVLPESKTESASALGSSAAADSSPAADSSEATAIPATVE